jgi:two-component system, chemotaxis family, protein-glutamate methylesterase/glutaminase
MMRQLPAQFRHDADLVAIGASAGGIDALFALLEGLPVPYPLPLVTVLHLPQGHASLLAEVFGRRLGRPVQEARSHAPIEAGVFYFAPPGYHLLVERDRSFSLSCEPPVLYSRPSIDVLLESVADACGERAVGMVLTGANTDGAHGLRCIKEAGGLTLVQDPAQAPYPVMPRAAIDAAKPDFVLPLSGLHTVLARLGSTP